MLLGGSVFSKLMNYDDTHLAAGDTETDTEKEAEDGTN
jgi:hypothetical protein